MNKTSFILLFSAIVFMAWSVIFFLINPQGQLHWYAWIISNIYIVALILSMKEDSNA